MEKEYFIELLHKYLRKESTIEEDQLLITYYNLFQSEADVMALLVPEKKDALKNQIYAGIQNNISKGEKRTGKVQSLNYWAARVAVAAAVLMVIVLSVFYLSDQKPASPKPALAYSTEKKQHHLFYLPDGSMVILSYGSKLEVAKNFNQSQSREIYLEGQAFFDIHHDPSKPFIVHANRITTTVLGTAFNVKSNDNDQQVIVTVSRGKVKVSDANKTLDLLTPDQQIVYEKKNGNAVKSHVHAASYLRWKNEEDLLLSNVSFNEAARLLEDRFGVSISFRDKALEKSRFTTVLLKTETLEQVIKSFCEFNGAVCEYQKNNAALLISKKEKIKTVSQSKLKTN